MVRRLEEMEARDADKYAKFERRTLGRSAVKVGEQSLRSYFRQRIIGFDSCSQVLPTVASTPVSHVAALATCFSGSSLWRVFCCSGLERIRGLVCAPWILLKPDCHGGAA
ncbi:hypothetical protein Ancab_019330 [Ancistrocladus abbreviatus]